MSDGLATVSEIDDAIRFGAGLRWAAMGTFLTYRIAGGEGGMRHFMSQFGPALRWPWSRLTDVPDLNAELIDLIATQPTLWPPQVRARLERLRDDCLVAVLRGLRSQRFGADSLSPTTSGSRSIGHAGVLPARAAGGAPRRGR